MVTPIMLHNAHANDGSETPPLVPAQTTANIADSIDQVRELLYGDALRHHGRRVEDLNGAMRDLEQRIMRRLDEMQNTVDTLARTMRVEQSSTVRSIGLSLAEMGRQIAATGDARGERGSSDANA